MSEKPTETHNDGIRADPDIQIAAPSATAVEQIENQPGGDVKIPIPQAVAGIKTARKSYQARALV
jgi:hypothetical protein